jgi:DNA-binding NarL/FixJ family response regulator
MDHETSLQLTEQELRVLRLVAQGFTNKKIACSLEIKERTVEYHLSQVFQRLDVTSRTAAAMKAEKTGLFNDQ